MWLSKALILVCPTSLVLLRIRRMVLAQKQKYISMEQDRKPRDKPTHLWSIDL